MGNGAVKSLSDAAVALPSAILKKDRVSIGVIVAHYTPSSFPLIPLINKNTSKILKDSWQQLVKKNVIENGISTSGITVFYNEFYERLRILDTSGRFEAVLTRNIEGMSMLQAKGAILIRMVKYIISISGDSQETQSQLQALGRLHATKDIRPWQYSIFVQTLLLTISSRLGTGATTDVMEAWVNMFAFVMKGMLPSAIEHQVVETEINVNVTSAMASSSKESLAPVQCSLSRKKIRANGGSTDCDSVSGFGSNQSALPY